VFWFKDPPDKFYVVLKGKINVWIPKSMEEISIEKTKIKRREKA
jgi:hypothetical protein